MALLRSLSLVLVFFTFTTGFFYSSNAFNFYVGGRDGWVLHPSESYNHWAERSRFLVNDFLIFKYKKGSDSVLEVNKNDYYNCNTEKPIKKMKSGSSVFKLDRSGPFFFISGNKANCEKGKRLIVIVLSETHFKSTPPSISPAPAPPVGQIPAAAPPKLPTPISPSPAPAITPVAPSPTAKSPVISPAPKWSPSPAPTAKPPVISPAPKWSPSPAPTAKPPVISPAPKWSPTPAPTAKAPSPAVVWPPPSASPVWPPTAAKSPVPSPAPSLPPPSKPPVISPAPAISPQAPPSTDTGSPAPNDNTEYDFAPAPGPAHSSALVVSPNLVVSTVTLMVSVSLGKILNAL